MQLITTRLAARALAPVACIASCVLAEPNARSDDAPAPLTGHVSTGLGGYTDSDHVSVLTPTVAGDVADVTRGWSIQGRYLVDVVSAASVDIVSTASRRWHEVRHAGTLEGLYKLGDFGVGGIGAISIEPDYRALAGGVRAELDFDEKNESLLFEYVHGHDLIGRTGTPFDVFSRTVDRNAFTAGVTFVVDRATILAFVGDVILERGDPSKPYRYIPMFAPGTAGNVPAGASTRT